MARRAKKDAAETKAAQTDGEDQEMTKERFLEVVEDVRFTLASKNKATTEHAKEYKVAAKAGIHKDALKFVLNKLMPLSVTQRIDLLNAVNQYTEWLDLLPQNEMFSGKDMGPVPAPAQTEGAAVH